MEIQVYTTDPATDYEYRLNDAAGINWFAHYGPDGGGFGYLSFRLKRRVGFNYPDIGYAYPITVYKGPWKCLFDGQITRITERKLPEGDEIEVWCLGWVHVANADTFNWVYGDRRYNLWMTSETPSGNFQPQKFSVDTSDRLLFKPRQGSTESGDFVSEDDYTFLRYTFSFGESAARFVADYDIALPGSFPAKAQVWAGTILLWEGDATGEGSLDLITSGSESYFEVRFVMTATGDVTAEDDTVYALFENVAVYSVASTLDQKVIADDIAALLSASYHGLSDDTRRIASPGFVLAHAAFDTDMTPADVLAWACQFGDADGVPLAWGVSFDDRRLLFLEALDLNTVYYILDPDSAENLERSGDWAESAQVVYGVYTDSDGQTQRTANYASSGAASELGGYYRRQAVNLSGIPAESLAVSMLAVYLNENAYPKLSGVYAVRSIRTPDGRVVPFDELVPGRLAQIKEFRALEAEASTSDFRDRVTTFMLYGVRVDYESGIVELMPDSEGSEFQRQMAVIEHLLG